jgi:hypothetical protein
MFAQMQTQTPRISVASRHVVNGAGRRDLRSVTNVFPLATWHGRGTLMRSSAYYCEAEPTWLQCRPGCMGRTSSWRHAHQSTCREPGCSIGGLLPLWILPQNDGCSEYLHQKMKRRLKQVCVCLSCELDEPCCCSCKDVDMKGEKGSVSEAKSIHPGGQSRIYADVQVPYPTIFVL